MSEEQAQEQMPKLTPVEPPDVQQAEIELAELPPDEWLVSPDVTQELVESMREWGLQQPVVVGPLRHEYIDSQKVYRQVYAGNRRVRAARQLGWETIRANIILNPESQPDMGVLEEQLNSTIKANPISQLENIERLHNEGYSDKQISKALKLKLGTVRAKMRLMDLHEDIRHALRHGKVSMGNADKIARMGMEAQKRLAVKYGLNGKIVWADVDEERRRKSESVTEGFDLDDFDGTPGADAFSDIVESIPEGSGFDPKEIEAMTRELEQLRQDKELRESAAQSEEMLPITGEAIGKLEEQIRKVRDGKKPTWSKADADSVEKLLNSL